jgi:hypothetical protein
MDRLARFALIVAVASQLAGCGESEIEPRSAASVQGDEWDPFVPEPPPRAGAAPRAQPLAPRAELAVVEPSPPPPQRPRSISLGYIGDEPLTPSPPTPPRWPWVAEPFHNDHWTSGYGWTRRCTRGCGW